MDKRLGNLVRFAEVDSVHQMEYLLIEDSWYQQGEALSVIVQYDNDYRNGLIRFSPHLDKIAVDAPHGCMTLSSREFMAVLVWLIRRGLLEDVGLIPTKTSSVGEAVRAGFEPAPTEPATTTPEDDEGTGELDYLWEQEEAWASIRSEILSAAGDEGDEPEATAPFPLPMFELVEGDGDPTWLEDAHFLRHLHHDLELSRSDIAKLCNTTYARVKSALWRHGIEQRSQRGGRSKIAPRPDVE